MLFDTQNVHCIGDRANHVILDIYERILTTGGGNVTEWRPRIEHAQIFAPADLVRIGKLGGGLFRAKLSLKCIKSIVLSYRQCAAHPCVGAIF